MYVFVCFVLVNTVYGTDYKSQTYLNAVSQQIIKDSHLPKMLNAQTRWVTVTAKYGQVIFHYTLVNYEAKDIPGQEFISTLKKMWQMTYDFCSSKHQEQSLLKHGVYITYMFYGRKGNFIGYFDILPEECGF